MRDPRNQPGPAPADAVVLGLSLACAVVVPLVAGLAADARFGTSPLGVVAGLVIGIVAAGCVGYVRFKRYW